jgi:hypothetical protein
MYLKVSVSRKQTRLIILLNNPAESQFISEANSFRAWKIEEGGGRIVQ